MATHIGSDIGFMKPVCSSSSGQNWSFISAALEVPTAHINFSMHMTCSPSVSSPVGILSELYIIYGLERSYWLGRLIKKTLTVKIHAVLHSYEPKLTCFYTSWALYSPRGAYYVIKMRRILLNTALLVISIAKYRSVSCFVFAMLLLRLRNSFF